MTLWVALAILITLVVGVFLYRWRSARSGADNESRIASDIVVDTVADAEEHVAPSSETHAPVSFQTEATDTLTASIYSLAFSVSRFDYQILGPHRDVLNAAKEAVAKAVNEQSYFPRKPALLPKLLRALNAGDSSREEIVRLILQDPVLAGNVLNRANSVFYRQSDAATESVDRAVVILGSEGLRAPVATAIMQPMFRLPGGFFEQFAPMTWELAQRTAVAAETHARITRAGDSFVAHLLGLLGGLGRLVLFRLTLDKYRNHNIMPRAEVFIRLMMDHERQVTRAIASAWEMSPGFIAAIDAQVDRLPPENMAPLARTLYYADLCGALAVLCLRGQYMQDDARRLLGEQGLKAELIDAMWSIASTKVPT